MSELRVEQEVFVVFYALMGEWLTGMYSMHTNCFSPALTT